MTEPLPETARLPVGARIPTRMLQDLYGAKRAFPAPTGLTHIQFRRFAGCPVCDLHLRSIARRADEIAAAGVTEFAVFHSTAEALRPHAGELPFHVIPDPGKELYRAFRVEAGLRAIRSPAAWGAILRGVWTKLEATVLRGRRLAAYDPTGGRLGLPADFLIAPDGTIVDRRYGEHLYDQWSVDDIIAAAQAASGAGAAKAS